MNQPPRRLVLANSLVDRAQWGEILKLESNPFFDDDDGGLFPRGMSAMRAEAKVAGVKTMASILPVPAGLDLPMQVVKDLMRSSMVNAIFYNSYIIGPRGILPQ